MILSITDVNQSCVRIRIRMSKDSTSAERARVLSYAGGFNNVAMIKGRTITARWHPRDQEGVPAWALRAALPSNIEIAPEP